MIWFVYFLFLSSILGDPEVSANLYCNLRTSVLWRLRDYLRLLMGHLVACNCIVYTMQRRLVWIKRTRKTSRGFYRILNVVQCTLQVSTSTPTPQRTTPWPPSPSSPTYSSSSSLFLLSWAVADRLYTMYWLVYIYIYMYN